MSVWFDDTPILSSSQSPDGLLISSVLRLVLLRLVLLVDDLSLVM